ncbi:MAG: hypothetical protein IT160_06510 [Bryobacterales bacterium]|nr:hypothetical protein [Bryobacterales bacterium]
MAAGGDAKLRLILPGTLDPPAAARLRSLAASLPFCGAPVRISFADELFACRGRLRFGHGPGTAVHAATFLRERRIVLENGLIRQPEELARVFTHELFHFAWPRLGNPRRERWEQLLLRERSERARGEAGWSSEWRKAAVTRRQIKQRAGLWKDYRSESFCDSGAWLYSGVAAHPEFTLAPRFLTRRRRWFAAELPGLLTI